MDSESVLCKRCKRIEGLHMLPDHACPDGKDTYTPTMPKGYNTKQHLMELVHHCWLHSGYPRNGYQQMSAEMKSLYHHCVDSGHE